MPSALDFQKLPDVSFIDDKEIDDVRGEMVADYEAFITEATGVTTSLARTSERRMELYAAAAQIYQAMQYVDRQGKQSLLKYSYDEFLDNLGALKGVARDEPKAATTTLRFTLSAASSTAVGIPLGTRASSGQIFFATTEYAEIPAGQLTVEAPAECTITGIEGNGLAVGELSNLADPVARVKSVENTTTTAGGADRESNNDYAERIYLAPSSFSTAGPEAAYIYHAKKFNTAVGDVMATSDQAAGTVDIVFIMADGSAPGEEMIIKLEEYLRDENIRPMTDLVTVSAPSEVEYSIDLKYYINRSDSAQAVAIQTAVTEAVENYRTWQRTIGRDINPSKLSEMVMAAGAKRVEITAPAFAPVSSTAVSSMADEAVINYGGLEDD